MNRQKDPTHDSFSQEALPHMDAAYNYALRLSGDPDQASDLVQETYLKAFRAFSSFEPGTNCRAWIFQILKNTYFNDRRRNRFWGSLPAETEPGASDQNPIDRRQAPVAPAQDDAAMLGDEVSSALDQLPASYRTIVILSDIEEYRYEEIAEFFKCPIGTIRSRLHRARKMLAASLGGYAGASPGFAGQPS